MDIQKIATYGTAAAVVGTGSVVGGNYAIDQQTGGVKGLKADPNKDYRQETPPRQ